MLGFAEPDPREAVCRPSEAARTLPLPLTLVVSSGDVHSPQTHRTLAKVCQLTSSKAGLGLAWRPDARDGRPRHATCGWEAGAPRSGQEPAGAVCCGRARDVLSCNSDLRKHAR